MINWPEIEGKSGVTLEGKYRETKSLRKTGEFFGSFNGVYAISPGSVSNKLKERGIKVQGKGGARRTQRIKSRQYSEIIKALPTSRMTRKRIKELTRLNDSQFNLAMQYFPFKYKQKRNIDLSKYLIKYNCENRKELLEKLYSIHRSTLVVAELLDRGQWTICAWMEKEGIQRDRTGVNARFKC